MQHILVFLAMPFRHSPSTLAFTRRAEPLDHPCLTGAGHAFIDDLPLPAYAVDPSGSVRLVGEA
jgi:hypothetical protein